MSQAIFASEAVSWCAPTNKWDQKSLEETAEKIHEYLRSDDFLLHSAAGTALVTMGNIMMKAGGNEHLAVGCSVRENARAFSEHAWMEWCINQRVECSEGDGQQRGVRSAWLDENCLREVDEYADFVAGRVEEGEKLDVFEFEVAFWKTK